MKISSQISHVRDFFQYYDTYSVVSEILMPSPAQVQPNTYNRFSSSFARSAEKFSI